jgi:hypothetical protein
VRRVTRPTDAVGDGALGSAHEAGALAEHDAVADRERSVRLDVATRIDERLSADREHTRRVVGRRA